VSLFTSVTGVFLVALLYRLPGLRELRGAVQEPNPLLRLASFLIGVGLTEEVVKAIPVLWIFVRNREPGTVREITYLGCVSGFAFGVSESIFYSNFYAVSMLRGKLPLGVFVVAQLSRLISLPLLHAVFAGIAAHLIALGVETPKLRRALILAGISLAALLHGLYDFFSSSSLRLVFAVASVMIFIAYVRSVEPMRRAVRAAAEDTESPPDV
jgi:RsiW-degrading membrane proteinase PrsW (M82 family)